MPRRRDPRSSRSTHTEVGATSGERTGTEGRDTAMDRRLIIGVLVGALLMSGAFVGVSFGEAGGADEATLLEFKWNDRVETSKVRAFPLRDYDGLGGGQITMKLM